MAAPDLDVVGVGNALVDVISHEDDAFVVEQGLDRGVMTLVEADRSAVLYGAMGPAVERSGGSAANTMAGLASLGRRGAFVGRVRDDQLGAVFTHDIRAVGVEFSAVPAPDGPATGRCLIVVTPDAERTMSTYLGAASELGPDDVDEALVARGAVSYLEGYLFDRAPAQEAFAKAAAACHRAGGQVALTLSDPFCVQRSRSAFRALVAEEVDLLFGNEEELAELYETDVEAALAAAERACGVVAMTRGARGSTVSVGGQRTDVAAEPVQVVDTTGAGDLFAAGFLAGFTTGRAPAECARLGSMAAAEVISHVGARPESDLAAMADALLAG